LIVGSETPATKQPEKIMVETLIKVDLSKPPQTREVLHHRGHLDIPMIAYVKPGDEFRVECVDWTGGQIANNEAANDVRDVDLTNAPTLSSGLDCTTGSGCTSGATKVKSGFQKFQTGRAGAPSWMLGRG
jgi:hypothetical protein